MYGETWQLAELSIVDSFITSVKTTELQTEAFL